MHQALVLRLQHIAHIGKRHAGSNLPGRIRNAVQEIVFRGIGIAQMLYLIDPEGLGHIVDDGGFVKIEHGVGARSPIIVQEIVQVILDAGIPVAGGEITMLHRRMTGQRKGQGNQ